MAFKIHSMHGNDTMGIEYLPCSAITPKVGMTLYFSSGKLAIAAGTTAPAYISLCERSSACTAGELIPVMRVLPTVVYGVTSSAAMGSINPGDKVTIATGGLQVTATTTSGVAEVVQIDDAAAGGELLVRFP